MRRNFRIEGLPVNGLTWFRVPLISHPHPRHRRLLCGELRPLQRRADSATPFNKTGSRSVVVIEPSPKNSPLARTRWAANIHLSRENANTSTSGPKCSKIGVVVGFLISLALPPLITARFTDFHAHSGWIIGATPFAVIVVTLASSLFFLTLFDLPSAPAFPAQKILVIFTGIPVRIIPRGNTFSVVSITQALNVPFRKRSTYGESRSTV